MATYKVLYNPLSNNGKAEAEVKSLSNKLENNELIFADITKLGDIKAYINDLGKDEKIIISGGDGTVRKQPTRVIKIGRNDPCPCGSGQKWKKCTCAQYHAAPSKE